MSSLGMTLVFIGVGSSNDIRLPARTWYGSFRMEHSMTSSSCPGAVHPGPGDGRCRGRAQARAGGCLSCLHSFLPLFSTLGVGDRSIAIDSQDSRQSRFYSASACRPLLSDPSGIRSEGFGRWPSDPSGIRSPVSQGHLLTTHAPHPHYLSLSSAGAD